jgi:hypothetical protein
MASHVLGDSIHRSARLLPTTTLAAVLLSPAAFGFAFHAATSAYEDQPHCRSPATGTRLPRPANHQSSPTPAVRRSSATASSVDSGTAQLPPGSASGGPGRGQRRNGGCTGRRAHGARNAGSARSGDPRCGCGMLRGRAAARCGRANPERGGVDHVRRATHAQTGFRGQFVALEHPRHARLGMPAERLIDASLDMPLEEVVAARALDSRQHAKIERGPAGNDRRPRSGIVGNRDGRDANRMAQFRPEVQLDLCPKLTMRPTRVQRSIPFAHAFLFYRGTGMGNLESTG